MFPCPCKSNEHLLSYRDHEDEILILVINVQNRPFWRLKNKMKNHEISLEKG